MDPYIPCPGWCTHGGGNHDSGMGGGGCSPAWGDFDRLDRGVCVVKPGFGTPSGTGDGELLDSALSFFPLGICF